MEKEGKAKSSPSCRGPDREVGSQGRLSVAVALGPLYTCDLDTMDAEAHVKSP